MLCLSSVASVLLPEPGAPDIWIKYLAAGCGVCWGIDMFCYVASAKGIGRVVVLLLLLLLFCGSFSNLPYARYLGRCDTVMATVP